MLEYHHGTRTVLYEYVLYSWQCRLRGPHGCHRVCIGRHTKDGHQLSATEVRLSRRLLLGQLWRSRTPVLHGIDRRRDETAGGEADIAGSVRYFYVRQGWFSNQSSYKPISLFSNYVQCSYFHHVVCLFCFFFQ